MAATASAPLERTRPAPQTSAGRLLVDLAAPMVVYYGLRLGGISNGVALTAGAGSAA